MISAAAPKMLITNVSLTRYSQEDVTREIYTDGLERLLLSPPEEEDSNFETPGKWRSLRSKMRTRMFSRLGVEMIMMAMMTRHASWSRARSNLSRGSLRLGPVSNSSLIYGRNGIRDY